MYFRHGPITSGARKCQVGKVLSNKLRSTLFRQYPAELKIKERTSLTGKIMKSNGFCRKRIFV